MSNSPSGRLPASVYRRRRITVAVIALLVIGLLGWGIYAAIGALSSEPENGSAPDREEVQQTLPAPSATVNEQPDGICNPDQIEVTASTDQNSYTADKSPVLIMQIKNTSEAECKVNVGTTEQEFRVMSGSDRIFSTSDCAAEGEEVLLDFKPGQQEEARFTWTRERSAPGCKPVNVQPRPGTYRFTAVLGEVESEPSSFNLE
ncbi:hypothetical protein [Glutamicibacter uratoxydans]|uniref:hypothetical protein n=1 Tax=Glutamicibacter uratoxydans TaxID=43667 RepID=UPI003D6F4BC6